MHDPFGGVGAGAGGSGMSPGVSKQLEEVTRGLDFAQGRFGMPDWQAMEEAEGGETEENRRSEYEREKQQVEQEEAAVKEVEHETPVSGDLCLMGAARC